jgi:hypothetical protein
MTDGAIMSRRALPALAIVAAVAVAVALPALTSAQSTGARDITVREKVQSIRFVHQQRSTKGDRLATGDRLLTRQRLFDDAKRTIGTLFTDCVNVGASARVFAATLQCIATYRFDDGQVVLSGLLHVGTAGTSAPIAGGSGAYRGARGEVTTGKPEKGFDIDVLHLDG